MIIVFVILVILAGLWIALNVVAKQCPTSKMGKWFNELKAKRALSAEQKKLRALENLKGGTAVGQGTFASDDASSNDNNRADVILQSGLKIPLSDNNRANGNRIYPATDVDDGIAS